MNMKKNRVGVNTQKSLLAAALVIAASGTLADSAQQTGVTAVERVVHSIASGSDYTQRATLSGNKWGKLELNTHGGDAKDWAATVENSGYKWNSAPAKSVIAEDRGVTATSGSNWANTSEASVKGYKWGVRNDADQAGYKWGVR